MNKRYISLGLMSGTSGDGVDASVINSNGNDDYESIKDKCFEYDSKIYKDIHELKDKINSYKDLINYTLEISNLERDITLFHAKIIKDLKMEDEDYLIGFHGQTIYHNAEEKISVQLGDAKLLHQLIKKKIIYNFRANDIANGGEGAPLAPIFHQLIVSKKKMTLPIGILNIGGISNITAVKSKIGNEEFFSRDVGPGNCLIDNWVRKNSRNKFDKDGSLAMIGENNEIIFEQAQELYANRKNKNKLSYDISDFDISFARGLSLEDGARTLTNFTASIIGEVTMETILKNKLKIRELLVCGGGRKNTILLEEIKKNLEKTISITNIDDYGIDGDFIESQAFAFLAIRSIINLPISFPNTTGCKIPCSGGELIQN